MAGYIPLSIIEEKIQAARSQIADLEREIRMLDGLRQYAVGEAATPSTAKPDVVEFGGMASPDGMGATDAVIVYVKANPGKQAMDIVDALENVVQTKSTKRRRLLINTLDTLRRAGRLNKDEIGRIFPAVAA